MALYINRKNNPENARTKARKQRKKALSYVIGYRNSSKKLESLDQSGILLCHNNNCDVIKAYQQIQLREEKVFFSQSVAERTNDTALYTI